MSSRDKTIQEIATEVVELTEIPKQRCMYKVHQQLREVSRKAYKPVLLAIGPYYNQDEVGQGFMKDHKLRYVKQMINGKEGSIVETKGIVETYFKALSEKENEIRERYSECIHQKSDKLVKMMLLDGCFIIQLFRKYKKYKEDKEGLAGDPIFEMKWVLSRIARDLLIFENQLPFFVLVELLERSESNVGSSTSTDPSIRTGLTNLALSFFSDNIPFHWNVDATNYNSKEKIENLLCRMHKALTFSVLGMVTKRLELGVRFKSENFEHLLGLIHASISISILDTEINNAIELHDEEEKAEKFKHPFCLISKAISQLVAKMKNMRNQEPLLIAGGEGDSEDWERESISFLSELVARVGCKMPKEIEKDLRKIKRWEDESIPHAPELQEAGVEFKEAKTFKVLYHPYRNEDKKSIPYRKILCEAGVEIKKAIKFMDLLALEDIGELNIHGAMELKEAGIEFKVLEKDKKLKEEKMFCIKFNKAKGEMEVSPLSIEDQTETCFRNLIAYEQYSCDGDKDFNYITDYVSFMDSLIDSPKDVQLLRDRGIIQNCLGDDEVISKKVNKLVHNIDLPNSIYARTSKNMNQHCSKHWPKWKAKLRHDYFNSPWAWISFLAAVLLLGLTIVQTIFSIIP